MLTPKHILASMTKETAGEYNGHPSHAHWNVALWVANHEGLYRMARNDSREVFIEWCTWKNELSAYGYQPRQTLDGVTVTPQLAGYAWDAVHEDDEDSENAAE